MKDLIDRLEKATAPHRRLDEDIAEAIGLRTRGKDIGLSEPYTSSLDAALTLVPKHHLWEVRQGIEAKATVWRLEHDYDEGGRDVPVGYSTTFPAIALCIAALRSVTNSAATA